MPVSIFAPLQPFLLLILLILPGRTGSAAAEAANVTCVYLQTAGATIDTATRSISTDTAGVTIRYSDTKSNRSIAVGNENYEISSWHFINSARQTDIRVYRQGSALEMSGTLKNAPFRRVVKIDEHPWYQVPECSFASFVKSSRQSAVFWCIRPTDFSVHKMVARRKKDAAGCLSGSSGPVVVTIAPSGIPERLWCATLQLSAENGSFIQSRMPSLFPGKPPLVVTLRSVSVR